MKPGQAIPSAPPLSSILAPGSKEACQNTSLLLFGVSPFWSQFLYLSNKCNDSDAVFLKAVKCFGIYEAKAPYYYFDIFQITYEAKAPYLLF